MTRRILAISAAGLTGLILGTLPGLLPHSGDSGMRSDPDTTRTPPAPANQGASAAAPEELLGVVLSMFSGEMNLKDLARLESVLERLSPMQMSALLDEVERSTGPLRSERLPSLFALWQKRDPRAATAWIQPRLNTVAQDNPVSGYLTYPHPRGDLILAWAKASPRDALEYARSHARTSLAAQLLAAAVRNWPESDDRTRLALLLDFPQGAARSGALASLLADWTKREPSAALATAQALESEEERQKTTAGVLRAWARKDAASALGQYRALALDDIPLLSDLLSDYVKVDPVRTANWLESLDAAQLGRYGPIVVEQWVERDPAAALTWALEHGLNIGFQWNVEQGMLHESLGRTNHDVSRVTQPLAAALEKQPEKTLAWLRSLPPGPERERLIETATLALKDVDQSVALFSSLSPEAAARAAFGVALKFRGSDRGPQWAGSLPPGLARLRAWEGIGEQASKALDLPPGPDRDAMLSGLAQSNTSLNKPIFALEHVMQIANPVLRRDIFEEVVEFNIPFESRVKQVSEWLDSSTAPEEWKRRWREALAEQAKL